MSRPPIIFSRRWWRICWLIVKEAFADRRADSWDVDERVEGNGNLRLIEDVSQTFAVVVRPPGDPPFVLGSFFSRQADARAAFRALKRQGFVNDGTVLELLEVLPYGSSKLLS